ncbi:MAG: hypothetical protein HKN07_14250 [Acidimicrobiia bacterium]|nr:hypothetical protein [Acidimicrobiia bacterium]
MIDRAVVGTLLRRPRLWLEAVRYALSASPRGWWRRRPFLPTLDRAYAEWRVATAYGSADQAIDPHDLVSFLEWRARQRRAS